VRARPMTEAEWEGCTDPMLMRDFLRGRDSERKVRLFACACARDLLAFNPDACPHEHRGGKGALESAILRAEDAADGQGPPLPPYSIATIWVEHPSAKRAGYVVFGADPDIGLLLRDPADAVKDFLVDPGLWLRDIFGPLSFRQVRIDPAWLAWNGGAVAKLAEAAYAERSLPQGTLDAGRLAVLADALEEAGCCEPEILGHCRQQGRQHVRGCWVVDLLLGKG
jgi:hypothetical protein